MAATAPTDPARLRARLEADAAREGFDAFGVTGPEAPPERIARLRNFVEAGHHGTMDWMAETLARRADPRVLWPEVRSIVMLGLNYGPNHDPRAVLGRPDRAAISVYAQNRDYHDIIKGKLKQIAGRFAAATGAAVKVFVDTAPVMEKPLAAAAGLGWQGKHTNLVSREMGSWLFLGAIFTDAALPVDAPEIDHCGSCRACLDACPTKAFPAPYRIDARRCISYLTIEHKGPVAREFRDAIGNRIYGCDDCLAACPWNKFARSAREAKLAARDDLVAPPLTELLALDDATFRARFSGSPVKRIGRDRFVRNCLIAAANSGNAALLDPVLACMDDASALVRGAAVHALGRLLEADDLAALARRYQDREPDPSVRQEWAWALSHESGHEFGHEQGTPA